MIVEFWPTNLPLLFRFLKRSVKKLINNVTRLFHLLLFPEIRLPDADFGLFILFRCVFYKTRCCIAPDLSLTGERWFKNPRESIS
jgi:hypothetical protein